MRQPSKSFKAISREKKAKSQKLRTPTHPLRGRGSREPEPKKIKPSRTVRLENGTPLRAKIMLVKEHLDSIDRKEYIGYIAEDNYIRADNGVVISKEIDGFPWLELNLDFIEEIYYIDPDEKATIREIKPEFVTEYSEFRETISIGDTWLDKATGYQIKILSRLPDYSIINYNYIRKEDDTQTYSCNYSDFIRNFRKSIEIR